MPRSGPDQARRLSGRAPVVGSRAYALLNFQEGYYQLQNTDGSPLAASSRIAQADLTPINIVPSRR